MRRLAALAIAGLVTLGGCRSEEQMRTALRESGINACVQGYQRSQSGAQAAGEGDLIRRLDPRGICTCTIDRMMADRTTDELQTIVAQPPTPDQRRMARECLMAAVEAEAPPPSANAAEPPANSSNAAAAANSAAPAPRPAAERPMPLPLPRPAPERAPAPTPVPMAAPAPPPPAPTGNGAETAR